MPQNVGASYPLFRCLVPPVKNHCFRGKHVFHVDQENQLRPFKQLYSSNQIRWKQTFRIKNFGIDLTFAIIVIKKVETFWWGVQEGKHHRFVSLQVQVTSLPASTHQPHQTCRTGVVECFTTSHEISSQNIDRKIIFLKKNQYIHQVFKQISWSIFGQLPNPLLLRFAG